MRSQQGPKQGPRVKMNQSATPKLTQTQPHSLTKANSDSTKSLPTVGTTSTKALPKPQSVFKASGKAVEKQVKPTKESPLKKKVPIQSSLRGQQKLAPNPTKPTPVQKTKPLLNVLIESDVATILPVYQTGNLQTLTTQTVVNQGVQYLRCYYDEQNQDVQEIRIEENLRSQYQFQIDGFAIGEGAHSIVYKSIDLNTLKDYALKIIPWTGEDDFILKEVQNINMKISLMQKLKRNDHFIQIQDYFLLKEAGQQQTYLLMELGQFNLNEVITYRAKHSRLFKNNTLLEHFSWFLEAIQMLHEKNLCHRDIKPSNIVYCRKDNKFKFTDFSEGKALTITNSFSHTVRGTPAFFSPEIKALYRQQSHHGTYSPLESDLYSLGLSFLCMATLKNMVLEVDIPSRMEEVKKNYDEKVNRIISTLLQKDSKQRLRYTEFIIMQNQLDQSSNEEDIEVYELMKQDQRHLLDSFSERYTKSETIVEGYLKMQDYDKALQLCQQMLQDKEIQKFLRFKILVLTKIVQIQCHLLNHEQACQIGMEALNLCKISEDPQGEVIGTLLNTLGVAFSKTDSEKALKFYEKAQQIAIQCFGDQSTQLGDVYNNIASLYHRMEDFGNAEVYQKKAIGIKKEHMKNEEGVVGYCEVLQNLGAMYNRIKQFEQAEKCFVEAVYLFKQITNQNGSNLSLPYLSCLEQLTTSLIFQKKIQQAEIILEVWHNIVQEKSGKGLELAEVVERYGMMYAMDQQFEKASEFYATALEIQESHRSDAETLMDTLFNYGLTQSHLGNNRQAKQLFERAMIICQSNSHLKTHESSIKATLEHVQSLEQ